MNIVRRSTWVKSAVLAVTISAMSLVNVGTASAATIKLGHSCSSLARKANIGSSVYQCTKLGKKNYWVLFSTPSLPNYEIKYLRSNAADVADYLGEADCRSRDGIMVGSAMMILADAFDTLANDAKYPPGVVASKYYARAATLAQFAQDGADEYDYGSEMTGYAKLQVVIKEAKPLLDMINKGLGTKYAFTYKASC